MKRFLPTSAAAAATVVGAMAFSSVSLAGGVTNLVYNGDFEAGKIGFSSDYTYGNVQFGGLYGSYWIGASPATAPGGAAAGWSNFGPLGGHGLMLIANGPASAEFQPLDVWSQTVAVVPDSTYAFTFWAATSNADSGAPAQIQAYVNGASLGGCDPN